MIEHSFESSLQDLKEAPNKEVLAKRMYGFLRTISNLVDKPPVPIHVRKLNSQHSGSLTIDRTGSMVVDADFIEKARDRDALVALYGMVARAVAPDEGLDRVRPYEATTLLKSLERMPLDLQNAVGTALAGFSSAVQSGARVMEELPGVGGALAASFLLDLDLEKGYQGLRRPEWDQRFVGVFAALVSEVLMPGSIPDDYYATNLQRNIIRKVARELPPSLMKRTERVGALFGQLDPIFTEEHNEDSDSDDSGVDDSQEEADSQAGSGEGNPDVSSGGEGSSEADGESDQDEDAGEDSQPEEEGDPDGDDQGDEGNEGDSSDDSEMGEGGTEGQTPQPGRQADVGSLSAEHKEITEALQDTAVGTDVAMSDWRNLTPGYAEMRERLAQITYKWPDHWKRPPLGRVPATEEAERILVDQRLEVTAGKLSGKMSGQYHRVFTDMRLMAKRGQVTDTLDAAIVVAIDVSGSMGGQEKSVAELHDALAYVAQKLDIPFASFAYDGDSYRDVIYKINEPHSHKLISATGLQAGGANGDLAALHLGLQWLDKMGKQKGVLIFLADGQFNSVTPVEMQRQIKQRQAQVIHVDYYSAQQKSPFGSEYVYGYEKDAKEVIVPVAKAIVKMIGMEQ